MTTPIVERLRRDFNGEPFDTAICRDVNQALDTIEELVEALQSIKAEALSSKAFTERLRRIVETANNTIAKLSPSPANPLPERHMNQGQRA